MATQTVEFRSPPSQTVTAKLFAIGSDTEVASASSTEATNRKGTYSAAYTDVAAGEYELIALVGAVSVARWFVTLTLTTATFQAYDKVGAVELDSDVRVKLDVTQPDYAPATVAALAAAKTILDKIDTGLVQDGLVYQFTANMLELGPSGGGGGGDATLAKQEEILTQLDVIQTKTDLIGTAAGATTLLAAAVLEPGTITSFPETLTIGDSYTQQNGRSIQIPIVDTDGNPISSTGSLDFANASVTFTLQRSGEADSTRVITGSASFVDPPGTGTGAGAPYAVIEIPASETSKGLKKYKYSGILTFLWSGTGTDVVSFETDTVTFDA